MAAENGSICKGGKWVDWKWDQLRNIRPSELVGPQNWSAPQRAHKDAAIFILLALGTNANGGFSRFMNAGAAAPKFENIYGEKVAGQSFGSMYPIAIQVAKAALPNRRDEMFNEIFDGLWNTNDDCRLIATDCIGQFMEELPKWKDRMEELTQDKNTLVQEAALGNFFRITWSKKTMEVLPASEIQRIVETVMNNPKSTKRIHDLAEVIRGAAIQAENK